jgi:hypothetical protein
MKTVLVSSALALACSLVLAKLPPPDDAAKAKAAETAAKAAWQAKVDAFQLCKVQDKVVAAYLKTAKASPKESKPAAAPAAPAAAALAAPAAAALAAPAAAAPAAPPAAAATAAAPAAAPGQSGASATTPVAFKPPPPCADPGPLAYNPPEQKPLESSGAHSPSGTAASPPSVKTPSAEMAPAKK